MSPCRGVAPANFLRASLPPCSVFRQAASEMQSNSNSGRKILIMLMCMASLMLSHSLLSQGVSMRVASAVDTKGVRHYANGQGRKGTPWMDDATYAPRPQYPYEATRR